MQNRPTAQLISSTGVRVNHRLAATVALSKPLSRRQKHDWKRTGAIAGVAVTSAGIAIPLASEQAMAYEGLLSDSDIEQQSFLGLQTAAPLMASALKPETSTAVQASFSNRTAAVGADSVSAKVDSLLSSVQDGSLKLSYALPADVSPRQAQTVVSELVGAAKAQASASQKSASLGDRQRSKVVKNQQAAELAVNSTANSELFVARQQVQEIQQKLAEFEASRGQQNMAAYRKVLASRVTEIAEQGTNLSANIDRNQRILTQLKMRLLTVDADVSLAERVLATDEEYQAVWARLQKAEQNMLEEFSTANIDGTRLNEIYGDYKYHQQWLTRAAEQAFPNYVMSNGDAQIAFVSKAPTAIDIMQNLVLATHQNHVQRLRQETLDTISQRLRERQNQLAGDIGAYEQLQRELATANELVAEYEKNERRRASAAQKQLAGQLVADVSSAPAEAPVDENKSPISQAQRLAPYFAEGTLSRTLLGIAIAAGTLATAAIAHRRHKKNRAKSIEPLETFSITPAATPAASTASFSLHGEPEHEGQDQLEKELLASVLSAVRPEPTPAISTDALVAELLEITRGDEALAAYQSSWLASEDTAESRTEKSLTAELSEIINETSMAAGQPQVPALTVAAVEDILGVEVIARELEEIMSVAGPALAPGRMLQTKTAIAEPIKLSVREIDSFAEQVIRWVLNDLGFRMANSSH